MRKPTHELVLLCALTACGGRGVVDGGTGGHGGSSSNAGATTTTSTTSGPGPSGPSATTTTGGDCSSLQQTLLDALDEAMRCDSCDDGPDPCSYLSGQELTDPCGCPMPVDTSKPDATAAALAAYQAWIGAGCGPLECGQPCAISNDPRCTQSGPGCEGVCSP